jgi:hypothetical protein
VAVRVHTQVCSDKLVPKKAKERATNLAVEKKNHLRSPFCLLSINKCANSTSSAYILITLPCARTRRALCAPLSFLINCQASAGPWARATGRRRIRRTNATASEGHGVGWGMRTVGGEWGKRAAGGAHMGGGAGSTSANGANARSAGGRAYSASGADARSAGCICPHQRQRSRCKECRAQPTGGGAAEKAAEEVEEGSASVP